VEAEATQELLRRIQSGDEAARQALCRRCLPLLQRWAHGRLPRYARDAADTDDLVQVAVLRALNNLSGFESSGSGSFLAYLRQILLNEVRTEIRKHQARGTKVPVDELALGDDGDSVVENLVGLQRLRSYEAALGALQRHQQEAVVMRIELGMSYQEIALETGGSADGVRMLIARALRSMARSIAESRH
jgi:RNA polymerase sigma-70 factor (ECF subfamily)